MTLPADLRLSEAVTAHTENASLNTAAMKRLDLPATGGNFVQISVEDTDSLNIFVASASVMCFPAVATASAGAVTYSAAATVQTAAAAEITAARYFPLAAGLNSDIPVRGLARNLKGVAVKSCGTGSTAAATNSLGMAYMRLQRGSGGGAS